jgi:hypothetical protein
MCQVDPLQPVTSVGNWEVKKEIHPGDYLLDSRIMDSPSAVFSASRVRSGVEVRKRCVSGYATAKIVVSDADGESR